MLLSKCVIVMMMMMIVSVCSDERRGRRRRPRFLSFNTLDGDVDVSLEFSIPFVSIPVKKTMETAFGEHGLTLPQVNVNVAGLALGAVVVLGTAVVVPFLMKSAASHYHDRPYARLLEHTKFGSEFALDLANQVMMDGQSLQRCAMKVACWTGQRSTDMEVNRLITQITGNTILSSMINATAFQEAMFTGRRDQDCSSYNPCPLRDDHMPLLFNGMFGHKQPFSGFGDE